MKIRRKGKLIIYILTNYWRASLLGLAGIVAVSILLSFKLATLTPAFSESEIEARAASAGINLLKSDPLYAPQKGLQYIIHSLGHHGPLAMRSVSIIIGLSVILGFYYVMVRWYTRRVALLTTLLLTTSAWFLHTVRLATPDATFLILFLFFVSGVWVQQSRRISLAFIAAALSTIALFYIPGMIWFLVPALIWQRRHIFGAIKRTSTFQVIFLALGTATLLAPLVLALVQQPDLYKSWLGLPKNWLPPLEILKNLSRTPLQLFWHSPQDPVRWLGSLPLLDWFAIAMFAVGIYAHWLKMNLDRTWLFVYVIMLGIVLASLGGPVKLVLILPFVYVVIGSGVALMLQQWFTVFPRNPVAKGLGLTFMVAAILGSSLYNIDHYFLAWPKSPETKAVFQNQP